MRRMLWVLVVLATACTGTVTTTTGQPAVTSTTVAPASTLPPVVECPGGGDFAEGTGIAEFDEGVSDSSEMARVSWVVNDQCETFIFEFRTSEGAPGTSVPNIQVDHLESFQVIRVRMGVDEMTVSDQVVETPLVDGLFAVTSLDRGMFIDLHLASPAAARARIETTPARLVLDLRPGLVEFVGESASNNGVVVVSPSDGAEVETETTINGYFAALDSDPLVTVVVDGEAVSTDVAERAAAVGWVEFSHPLDLPQGSVTVLVGDTLGDSDLVTLNLTVR